MPAWQADILMYHSISDAPGPTSIAPDVFAAQMQALAASGLPVVTPDALANPPAPRVVIISFDDGFQDFADTAWPILREHGFCPIVYLPSGLMGGTDSWAGGNIPPRPLMEWDRIETLAGEGVCFGAHSVSHPDLSTLDAETLEEEVTGSGQDIAARLGQPVRHFAPPYGASNPNVRAQIARHYDTSVGTRLGVAGPGDDIHDLPRLEMFYFTDIARWQAHLAGRGGSYLATRKLMRGVRSGLSRVLPIN
ncbi:polysaccharide deacetylase family protein [Ruegeria sp. HKCCD6157]|uniref:polysaccharide deacetylase family protein n=1 Tax=Ruegeria sp. HKCCD6157 TaxID=2690707 RepID=UPI0014929A9D|nr:polysaccharide deacetylase family protein [Ruegeria sp. HKCCD6157]NOE28398.1 polysaccharide deacetylase family protein [Ruegeria sp. HKCCD6157]